MTEEREGYRVGHSEALCSISTKFVYKKFELMLTTRNGATPDDIIATAKAVFDVIDKLPDVVPVIGNGYKARQQQQDERAAPPRSNGSEPEPDDNGVLEFPVVAIEKGETPKGNEFLKVTGGKWRKHGATAWPEVAIKLPYDMGAMENGQQYAIEEEGWIAICLPTPSGNPGKVIDFYQKR